MQEVAGSVEAKEEFSIMVIVYTCLAKVRAQGQHYTLVLSILWYQIPMHMGGDGILNLPCDSSSDISTLCL